VALVKEGEPGIQMLPRLSERLKQDLGILRAIGTHEDALADQGISDFKQGTIAHVVTSYNQSMLLLVLYHAGIASTPSKTPLQQRV
jgi:hypothetical protein